jgi:hypothetical protein
VEAVTEGDVAVRLSAQIQSLGILENGGIAVRGGEASEDHLAAAESGIQPAAPALPGASGAPRRLGRGR